MIGRLRGTLLEKQPPEILLDVNGVGYEIKLPMSCFYELGDVDKEVIIYTHFVVREDAQLLYGFNNKMERLMFRELIKVNGVGPKLGLAILSGMTANQFAHCVEHDDINSLIKLPGVGKKTAERLLVEMRDRLKNWVTQDLFTPEADKAQLQGYGNTASNAIEEAEEALVGLGYKPAQVAKMIKQVAQPSMSCEEIIRLSLRATLQN
ncbi:MAG: Holliday junction branch migration protein RuvA [Moritella sp.]|uniref:Holliday junction branch migration protein RuvA n=1 Tax=Moritella sp. TaxID=78556 RepID=UPI001DBC3508|nr:Holliday junction branch migration protein RuvA [Moritella sp.]NQZ50665.1 Holliday junction branch migration protein RuvA [Moritella sp.]